MENLFQDENGNTIKYSDLLILAEEKRNLSALRILAPYLHQSGESINIEKSVHYYEILATEFESFEAMMFLSWYHRENNDLSIKWLKKAADLNYSEAIIRLAHNYQARFPNLQSSIVDLEEIDILIHYSTIASKLKDSKSSFYMGQLYQFGHFSIERDLMKALEFYLSGSDSFCILSASDMLLNGDGITHDKSKAIQLIITCAKSFGVPSLKPVADMVFGITLYFKIEEDDPKEAFSLYCESAKQGDGSAAKIVGDCYYFGIGTESNLENAMEYYEKGISLGSIESTPFLIRILWERKQKSNALELFQNWINTLEQDKSSFKDLSTFDWYERLENFLNY